VLYLFRPKAVCKKETLQCLRTTCYLHIQDVSSLYSKNEAVGFYETPASFNMNLVISKCVTAVKVSNFSGHYHRNRSTLDICVLGYIGLV